MSLRNLLTEHSRLLLGSLAQAGVRDAVISPGSRSTPFAWAAFNTKELRCHSVLDERSAAFFALGQARVTGVPSLLICTSGSALANYFPAVVEASLAHVPLLILSADRPFELQDCRASQCVDQTKLFGDFCRSFVELGLPDAHPSALSGVQRVAAQAVLRTHFPTPGPVHLNARARKPLEPEACDDAESAALTRAVDNALSRGVSSARPGRIEPDREALLRIVEAFRTARHGLIACGPDAALGSSAVKAISELSARTGFPVFCEAASQFRFNATGQATLIDGFDWLLRVKSFRQRHAPDLVLCFGDPLTASSFEPYLAAHSVQRFAVARHGFPDPQGNAQAILNAEPGRCAEELGRLLREVHPSAEVEAERARWKGLFERANAAAWQTVQVELDADSSLGEGKAVASVVNALPDAADLVLGNSLPIREVDSFVRARERGFRVLHQRGASGIDGLISGAAGSAVASRRATLLLLGDVSFLHDVGGLGAACGIDVPLVIAVIDNDGGRIFEQLPVQTLFEKDERLARLWLTPHGLSLEHAAALFRHRYQAANSAAEIQAAVQQGMQTPGVTVLHLRVPEHSAREQQLRITERLEGALAGEPRA